MAKAPANAPGAAAHRFLIQVIVGRMKNSRCLAGISFLDLFLQS